MTNTPPAPRQPCLAPATLRLRCNGRGARDGWKIKKTEQFRSTNAQPVQNSLFGLVMILVRFEYHVCQLGRLSACREDSRENVFGGNVTTHEQQKRR